jgi:hypothetical protein
MFCRINRNMALDDYTTVDAGSTGVAGLLKGLSHEIDFKNFDKKLHNLA